MSTARAYHPGARHAPKDRGRLRWEPIRPLSAIERAISKARASHGLGGGGFLPDRFSGDEYQAILRLFETIQGMIDRRYRKGRKGMPKAVLFEGRWYPLAYSNLGRFFVCDKDGRRLLASGYPLFSE